MIHEIVAGEIVDAAHHAGSLEQFRLRVLEQVRRIAACDSALFLPAEAGERPVALDRRPALVPHYHKHKARYDVELARAHALGVTRGAYVDTEVFSAGERSR